MQTVVKGVVGLTKYSLKIDQAKSIVISDRRKKCSDCIHNNKELIQRCNQCECVILAKTSIASEKCPLGFWVE